MSKGVFYIFLLIVLFLVLAYFKGFVADTQAAGGAVSRIILYLQGRNDAGNVAAYPAG